MSIFDRLDRLTSRTVDRVHANAFACQPMLSTPNGRPQLDPDRPAWEGRGVLDEAPILDAEVEIGKRDRSGNSLHTLVTGCSFELSIDRTRYAAADTVRQGDRITIGTRAFDVAEIQPDGLSRIVLGLVLVGR